jgi:hypothetical protein
LSTFLAGRHIGADAKLFKTALYESDYAMKTEKEEGCRCPRCDDRIPEQFYCRHCGYVPDWRERPYEACKEAA